MATKKIEKKMKEKGEAEKKKGRAESFSQKFIAEVIDVHLLQTEAYISSGKGKLQNNMKQQNYNEGRKEKNQKRGRLYTKQGSRHFR